MHLSITYRTEFVYPAMVRQSHNELRAAPTTSDTQVLLSYRVVTEPAARVHTYADYFGTLVDAFGVRNNHERLVVGVEATVDTAEPAQVESCLPMAELAQPWFLDLGWEYLQPTHHAHIDPVRSLVEPVRQQADTPDALLDELTAVAHGALSYRSGSTQIGESLEAILERGEGVCQDYAHLLVALCRASGIPARYVSGYLYAVDSGVEGLAPIYVEPDGSHSPVEVQTHAWVEALLPGPGWVARDPTNLQVVGERHVKIGAGRDYDDVTPLKGVYAGGADESGLPVLDAQVEMRQLADLDRRDALRERAVQQRQQ